MIVSEIYDRQTSKTYIPESSDADKLHILGTDVAHLISTIDHNLDPVIPSQRKVAYDNLPEEALPAFRRHFAKRAQTFLESLDRWLAQRDRDVTVTGKGTSNIDDISAMAVRVIYKVSREIE